MRGAEKPKSGQEYIQVTQSLKGREHLVIRLSSLGSINKGTMFMPSGAPLSKRLFSPLSARER